MYMHVHVPADGFTIFHWTTAGSKAPRNVAIHWQRQWRRGLLLNMDVNDALQSPSTWVLELSNTVIEIWCAECKGNSCSFYKKTPFGTFRFWFNSTAALLSYIHNGFIKFYSAAHIQGRIEKNEKGKDTILNVTPVSLHIYSQLTWVAAIKMHMSWFAFTCRIYRTIRAAVTIIHNVPNRAFANISVLVCWLTAS